MSNKVLITNSQKAVKVPSGLRILIRRACNAVLEYEHFDAPAEISVTFVDNAAIAELNNQYRNKPMPTDVLSFPLGENGKYDVDENNGCMMLGDIVISMERALEQANLYGHPLQREVAFLTVHSMLPLLGYDHVNQYCRAIGLTQTSLQRKMLDFQAIAEGRNNYTSPADLYRVFSLLYHGEILNKPLREVAFDFLSRCRSTDALQRYIPDAVTVLHKPGGLDHLNHDVGIFLTDDRPYYLGIFTWDGPALDGQPQQNRLIGQLSRMIYDAMKGEK